MPRRDAETGDPMNVEAALRAVEGEALKLSFQVRLYMEEFQTVHLRVDRDWM
jgi:hypothetical protein